MLTVVNVKVRFDEEAKVWYVESSNPPGVNLEAASLDALQAMIPAAVTDLIEETSGGAEFEVPIEITAYARSISRAFEPQAA